MNIRPRTLALSALLAAAVVTLGLLIAVNLLIGNKAIDRPLARAVSLTSSEFPRIMGTVLPPPFVGGNHVDALVNGDQIFPAMLSAIRQAESTITLETYIYWSGDVGRQFADALRERAAHGVRVHVLIDWFGGEVDETLLASMRDSGIRIHRYNAPAWDTLHKLNQRSHRRLMVIDGRIGFIGGAGLSDQWSGNGAGEGHWRDTHFRVEGPVVAQLQSASLDNWIQTTGDVSYDERFFPPLVPRGDMRAHVFAASPGGGVKSMQLMYLLSITSATSSIDLSAAYFVPDEVAMQSLVAALGRGVRVRIIVPGPYMDRDVVLRASRYHWGRLLAAGAEIYRYQPAMYHCKVMIVDATLVSVGSTNFDSRSFSINDEANLNVYDAQFAREQTGIFERDIAQSRRVDLAEWQARRWWTRAADFAATLLDSQL